MMISLKTIFFYDSHLDIPVTKSDWHPDSKEVDSNKDTNNNSVSGEEGIDDVGEDDVDGVDDVSVGKTEQAHQWFSFGIHCFKNLRDVIERSLTPRREVCLDRAFLGAIYTHHYCFGEESCLVELGAFDGYAPEVVVVVEVVDA